MTVTIRKSQRLTLMEVISVMLIIIVLITILLPVYVKSRELGKNIVCKSNLKTLGEAALSYAHDHAGMMPYIWNGTYSFEYMFYQSVKTVSAQSAGQKFVLNNPDKYLPTPKLVAAYNKGTSCYPADYSSPLACPSQKIEYRNELLYKQIGGAGSSVWRGSHYACSSSGLPVLAVKTPHKHVVYADSYGVFYLGGIVYLNDYYIYGRHFGAPVFQASTFNLGTSSHPYEYHGPGSSNMIMYDGHVEGWTWAAVYNRWNKTYCPFNSVWYAIP